jgi:hypothetical protein
VPEFILKLYSILEVQLRPIQKNELDSIIGWGPTGTEIVIKDVRRLERSVLPHFFRHNKLESFVRQLNMYNFRKLNKFSKMRNRELYFQNEHFRQGNMYDIAYLANRWCSFAERKREPFRKKVIRIALMNAASNYKGIGSSSRATWA